MATLGMPPNGPVGGMCLQYPMSLFTKSATNKNLLCGAGVRRIQGERAVRQQRRGRLQIGRVKTVCELREQELSTDQTRIY